MGKQLEQHRIISDTNNRTKIGKNCGIVGIVLNAFLFSIKLFGGIMTSSIGITADAFNNLSDAGSSIITLLGFKIASSKPDAEHPYGHGRMEYISSFIVSGLILATSVSLIKDSISQFIEPNELNMTPLSMIILLISIVIKIMMGVYNTIIGRKIESVVVKAAAVDSFTDCISTFAVLVSSLLAYYYQINIDAYIGLGISLVIGYAGFKTLKKSLDPLLGKPPRKEDLDIISEICYSSDPQIQGVHDILIHDYGPGRLFVSLHVEVPSDCKLTEIHDVIDHLERKIDDVIGCTCTVHMDPKPSHGSVEAKMEGIIRAFFQKYIPGSSIHDVHVDHEETQTIILFDVEIPNNTIQSDSEIIEEVCKYFLKKYGIHYVIKPFIDRSFH